MKTTSIVFLVIAALLMVGGAITCAVAGNIAETDGYVLFEDMNSGYALRDFSNSAAAKMSISVNEAEIYLYGGAESSYLEVINFRDDLYTLTTVGTTILFEETPSFETLLDFDRGFSFKGIRNILRRDNSENGKRRVNIYLSEDTQNIKQICIKAKNCTIYTDSITNHCDINIEATQFVTLHSTNMTTNCSLSVTAQRSDIRIENARLHTLFLSTEHTETTAENIAFNRLDLAAAEGSIFLTTPIPLQGCTMTIGAGTGDVTVGGLDIPRPYEAVREAAPCEIRFTSEVASLTVTSLTQ